MIRLTKLNKPSVLEQSGPVWQAEYLAAKNGNCLTKTIKFRYRHPDIKQALVAESHGKCVYCESKITHVYPGESDHILPIHHRPDLIVDWANLAFVCTECNRPKSDYYNQAEPLINPFIDEPADHLLFFGPAVLGRDNKGYLTRRQLNLTRLSLIERKQEQIERVNVLVTRWQETSDGPTRDFMRDEIVSYARDPAEFAATIRAYLFQALGWRIDQNGQVSISA